MSAEQREKKRYIQMCPHAWPDCPVVKAKFYCFIKDGASDSNTLNTLVHMKRKVKVHGFFGIIGFLLTCCWQLHLKDLCTCDIYLMHDIIIACLYITVLLLQAFNNE